VAVAELALMETGHIAEMSSRPVRGDGPFCEPSDGGRVVGAVQDGVVLDVAMVGHDVELGKQPCLFEVAVGDSAGTPLSSD